jgi:genome maintenance exonuclease 1
LKTFNHDFVPLPKLHRVTADDGKRYYVTPDGNAYQSVTTLTGKVNEKAIKAWREKVGEEEATKISTRAANRGTSMHKLCEKYLLNKIEADPLGRILLEDVNPLSNAMFLKIIPLMERLDNIKVVEGTMYSDSLQLAGTADCIAEYSGDLAVIDFKTSTYPKKKEYIGNYFMQGAAYGKMYEEMFGETPKRIVIMMSVENTGSAITYIEPYDKCLEMLMKFIEEQV